MFLKLFRFKVIILTFAIIKKQNYLCTKSVATADTHYWQLSPVYLYDELKR